MPPPAWREPKSPLLGTPSGIRFGVIVGILVVSMVVNRQWAGEKDTPSLAGLGLDAKTVIVSERINLRNIPEWKAQDVPRLHRDETVRVAIPGEDLEAGDKVVVVGVAQRSIRLPDGSGLSRVPIWRMIAAMWSLSNRRLQSGHRLTHRSPN